MTPPTPPDDLPITMKALSKTPNGPPLSKDKDDLKSKPTDPLSRPVHGPDVVAFFDPASAGGGGPLKRITTQQRERAEAEARERAERAHREAGLPSSPVTETHASGGILNRFRSTRKPQFLVPLIHEEHPDRPTLSPTWSSDTLAQKDVQPEQPEDAEEYHYPDGGYGWIVVICCMALSGCTMG